MIAGLITVALFALAFALLAEPRGRHHVHARLIARPFERRRLTVAELEARLEAEARRPRLVPRKFGSGYIALDVQTDGFDEALARVLDELVSVKRPANFEKLGPYEHQEAFA
ncbi:hypothetical protein Jolie2_35 [Mycobacterium phage Jolie2]|uniref:Uncharacterized protein n=1 Tax=Mycobacterium phage Jolie2 TaxID=1458831 RepID=W8EHZ9_9CAUD|nr:hypothetical protein Jolie2_35 [Mycobacterium phage Jolie2]AHJ86585.1 hypothetical protein Jolie2_35 [Mycobacterium phage Jolie2]